MEEEEDLADRHRKKRPLLADKESEKTAKPRKSQRIEERGKGIANSTPKPGASGPQKKPLKRKGNGKGKWKAEGSSRFPNQRSLFTFEGRKSVQVLNLHEKYVRFLFSS